MVNDSPRGLACGVLAVLAGIAGTAFPLAAATCAADLDGDGIVGGLDEDLLRAKLGPVDPADPVAVRADLNGNHYVCGADLLMLYDSWGPCPTCPADLNGDLEVDEADRSVLEDAYELPCRGNLGRGEEVDEHDQLILQLFISEPGAEPHPDVDWRADLNEDGVIDAADEAELVAALGTPCGADLSSDGQIDATDLWLLLAAWGPCPGDVGPSQANDNGRPPDMSSPDCRG